MSKDFRGAKSPADANNLDMLKWLQVYKRL